MIAYHKSLLIEPSLSRQSTVNRIIACILKLISQEQNVALMHPISFQEVEAVILALPHNKALGPNGYTSDFFKVAWIFLGKEIYEAVKESC